MQSSSVLLTLVASTKIPTSTRDQTRVSTDMAKKLFRNGIIPIAVILVTSFHKSPEEKKFPCVFPTVIRLLAPNDIMNIQPAIVYY